MRLQPRSTVHDRFASAALDATSEYLFLFPIDSIAASSSQVISDETAILSAIQGAESRLEWRAEEICCRNWHLPVHMRRRNGAVCRRPPQTRHLFFEVNHGFSEQNQRQQRLPHHRRGRGGDPQERAGTQRSGAAPARGEI